MATSYDSDYLHSVDDLYFSALHGDEGMEEEGGMFPDDAKYAEALQFQEALMGSILISQMNKVENPVPDHDGAMPETKEKAVVVAYDISPILGESSLSFCGICMERKEKEQMFEGSSCVHSYCLDCIGNHVLAKLNDNVVVVTCPAFGCEVVLELETCRPTLPKSVIEAWSDFLCRKMVEASEVCCCPYKDCLAMMVADEKGNITEAECPVCHRLFCARCSVPWHAGVECEAYQRLNEDEKGRDDLVVIRLAEEKKWSRCPNCRFYVEKTAGCPHIVCRCRFEFCYGCGSQWTADHGGCTRN